MTRFLLATILSLFIFSGAEARSRVVHAHERCNIDWPCEGVTTSARGEMVVRAMGGFGTARKIYRREAKADPRHIVRERKRPLPMVQVVERAMTQIVSHPSGCPTRAFCGCGAAVEVFGAPIRSLWLAANWFKFPRTSPRPGAVAVRRHHVFVLKQHIGGDVWRVFDANSGGGATRVHERSIAGYTIVSPQGAS